jgi:hypothetical protein
MSANPGNSSNQPARAFNFSEIFWQKTAGLFVTYWLLRWLIPSLLPESLRAANFQVQMLACGLGGLVFTVLAAASQGGGAKPKDQQLP